MGKCGPGDVLVVEAHSPDDYACIVGNMKARQLWHNKAEGIVTDAAMRDVDMVAEYDLGIFAKQRSPAGNLPYLEAYEDGEPINCGGVLVMPGDYITADDGGVIVVPEALAAEVVAKAAEYEALEGAVKRQLEREDVSPGKYYPFNDAARNLLRIEREHNQRS